MGCQTRGAMEQGTGLRLGGFALAALGALVAGIGAVRVWLESGIGDDTAGVLTTKIYGIDVLEGRIALALAVAGIVLVLAVRLVTGPGARRTLAVLALVAGLGAAGAATWFGLTAGDEATSSTVGALVREATDRFGLNAQQARDQVEQALQDLGTFNQVQPWVWVCAGGGVALALGATLTLAWTRRFEEGPEVAGATGQPDPRTSP
jgi:hypothetical protein